MFEKLIKKYKYLLRESEDGIITYKQLEESTRDFDFKLDEETKSEIKDEVLTFASSDEAEELREKLSDFENYLSIVFSINKKLLMTGDARKSALRAALKNMKDVVFDIFKVPHHGTKNYYHGNHWNNESILLIPNSTVYSSWDIERQYCFPNSNCRCLNPSKGTACPLAREHGCPNPNSKAKDYEKFNL